MPKPKSILENELHEILWSFKIQTDQLITASRPDLVIINKKKKNKRKKEKRKPTVDFAVSVDHRAKIKENRKRDQYLNLTREQKQNGHKIDGDTNCYCYAWNYHQRLDMGAGRVGNWTTKTIKTTALLRSARILRRVLEISGYCCHSGSTDLQQLRLL